MTDRQSTQHISDDAAGKSLTASYCPGFSRFASCEEYQRWCENMVVKIYYAQIAMNNESIKKAVAEIGAKLWLPEGLELFPCPEEKTLP